MWYLNGKRDNNPGIPGSPPTLLTGSPPPPVGSDRGTPEGVYSDALPLREPVFHAMRHYVTEAFKT